MTDLPTYYEPKYHNNGFVTTGTSTGSTITWNPPVTVYRYQVTCPKCKHLNWAELDTVIWCAGKTKKGECNARLRVVSEVVDYEVAVVLG